MTKIDDEQDIQAREWLQQIAQGDQSALEAFYQCYEPRVYRYALSRLNQTFDAADTLNEVMMEVWKYADRFEGRSKVSTWLLGITHHKVYDRLRKRKRSNMEDDVDDFTNTISDDEPDIQNVLAGVEDAKMVKHCMDNLTSNHREVIHLAFFEDLHYREIADITQKPEGTIKTRIFHAKQALKTCLSKMMTMESLI